MNTLPLDPTIAALADQAGPPADPIPWDVYFAWYGVTREHYFAAMASTVTLDTDRMLAGYRAREGRARGARHLAYSEGAVKAPRKPTRADQVMADVRAFDLDRKAVA